MQYLKNTCNELTAVNLHGSLSFVENKIRGLGQTIASVPSSCTGASLKLME